MAVARTGTSRTSETKSHLRRWIFPVSTAARVPGASSPRRAGPETRLPERNDARCCAANLNTDRSFDSPVDQGFTGSAFGHASYSQAICPLRRAVDWEQSVMEIDR